MLTLKSLISFFELVSGLKVNWSKTHLWGISLPESECIQMAHRILKFTFGRIIEEKKNGEPGLDHCKRRLTIWKANYLSFGGRMTPIKATLSNLPIY